ncbi:MAG: site-2 protease family protein [bacterium]
MIWLTVLVFIVLLLALILAHEWGHYIAAKKAGCGVEEFAFGFPPRLFSVMRGGTRFSFNLLPIGGYVKIEGEDMNDPSDSPTNFGNKSAPWRLFIIVAGVLMNVVLAAVLLSIQAGLGVPSLVTEENANKVSDLKAFVVEVAPNSPAEQAGIEALDRIISIGPVTNPTTRQVQSVVSENLGQSLEVEVERRGVHKTITATPRVEFPAEDGALGVSLQEMGLELVPWWQAPAVGVARTGQMLVGIVSQFWLLLHMLISQGTTGEVITGPVGIAVYTNEVTNMGISYILEFAALISLNLALINILPFPALDGGRILFIGLEVLARRRLPARIEQATHMAGFVVLILLMLFITLKDITRFF